MNSSLNVQTYENLKRDFMTLDFMPGEPVSAAKIAEKYNVSRTPAREALVRLEGEALVDIYPQSASVISKIDVDRANQEWFVRKTLEMGVVDGMFERITEDDLDNMRELNDNMREVSGKMTNPQMIYEYLRYDNEFHTITYLAAGQELAAELVGKSMTHYNRIRLLADMQNVNKDRTLATHDQLIKCIEQKDKESYRSLLFKHLSYFKSDIEALRQSKRELFKD